MPFDLDSRILGVGVFLTVSLIIAYNKKADLFNRISEGSQDKKVDLAQ